VPVVSYPATAGTQNRTRVRTEKLSMALGVLWGEDGGSWSI
jgi:hypothetical protein